MTPRRAAGLEDEGRAALWRSIRANRAATLAAERDAKLASEARISIRRHARVDAAVARLQGFLTMLHDRLREDKREALARRDYGRARLLELDIDCLYREFDDTGQGLAEGL